MTIRAEDAAGLIMDRLCELCEETGVALGSSQAAADVRFALELIRSYPLKCGELHAILKLASALIRQVIHPTVQNLRDGNRE